MYERYPGVITEKWLGDATLAVDRGTVGDFERLVPASWRSGVAASAESNSNASVVNTSGSGGSGGQE